MRDHSTRDPSACDTRRGDCGSLVFVGSALFFPDSLLRFIRAEFDTLEVLRVADHRALAELVAGDRPPRLCVVEERYAADLAEELAQIETAAAEAPVALAYYRPELARQLLPRDDGREAPQIGYVPMRAHMDVWLAALRIQLCGERFVPNELLSALRPEPEATPPADSADPPCAAAPKVPLTERELEVLKLVSHGEQNKAIANELGLSEHTVKLHVHNVLTKLKVRNRTGATTWFMQQRPRPVMQGRADM